MKITIDTQNKIVTIEQCVLNEIEKVRSAIVAMGMNPDEFSIQTIQQFYPYYPSYPVASYYQPVVTDQPFIYRNDYTTEITN